MFSPLVRDLKDLGEAWVELDTGQTTVCSQDTLGSHMIGGFTENLEGFPLSPVLPTLVTFQ